MAEQRWVAVQVRYPTDVWVTGRDAFRIRVCERGGQFLPDSERHPDTVVTAVSSHQAASVADAAMRAIEAVEGDGLHAGIGHPTAINVEVLDRKPSGASLQYRRRV